MTWGRLSCYLLHKKDTYTQSFKSIWAYVGKYTSEFNSAFTEDDDNYDI